jgi:hypothetical protein
MAVMQNETPDPMDLGMYTQMCFCGDQRWEIWVVWDDDKEIASYSKEMYCVTCKTKALTPPFDED